VNVEIIVIVLFYVIFAYFINLAILRSPWEFREPNLGNSRKREWKHWLVLFTSGFGGDRGFEDYWVLSWNLLFVLTISDRLRDDEVVSETHIIYMSGMHRF